MDRFRHTRRPDPDRWRERWPDPAGALRNLGLEPGTVLVDAAPDTGYFTLPAAELVAPATGYAVDPEGRLLDELAAAAVDRGIETLRTVSGDRRELSAALPEPVDAVLLADAFAGLDAPATAAEQAYRSLRPGGRFLVLDRGAAAAVRDVVEPAGFSVAAEVDLGAARFGLAFRRAHDQ